MRTKIVAKTLIFNEQGHVLVLKRSRTDSHRPGGWDLPGGGVAMGEDPNTAALRETMEEAGIETISLRPLYIHSEPKEADVFNITIVYGATTAQTLVQLSAEHDAYEWLTPEMFMQIAIPEKYKTGMQAHQYSFTV